MRVAYLIKDLSCSSTARTVTFRNTLSGCEDRYNEHDYRTHMLKGRLKGESTVAAILVYLY